MVKATEGREPHVLPNNRLQRTIPCVTLPAEPESRHAALRLNRRRWTTEIIERNPGMTAPRGNRRRDNLARVALGMLAVLLLIGSSVAGEIAGGAITAAPSALEACSVIGSCSSVGPRPSVITWDGSALWVTHLGPGGPQGDPETLYRIDPVTCAVLRQIPTPGPNISGLVWADGTLWCHPEETGEFYELDPSDGSVLAVIPAPSFGEPTPNGSDLAWDGTSLWHASYGTAMVYRIDPSNGDVLDSFASPGSSPSGIDIVDETLVMADFTLDEIHLVQTDGTLLSSCASPDTHPWGIQCVDGETWVAGLASDQYYKLDITLPNAVAPTSWGAVKAGYR
jgi:outer membrane protein assembly factor BamB